MLQGLDCSPTYGERELGLDRRETGWFYPTGGPIFFNMRVVGSDASVREERASVASSVRGRPRGRFAKPRHWEYG